MKTGFAYDLARMMTYTAAAEHQIDLRCFILQGTILPDQRASLVRKALAVDATHLLFLDSDMRFPKAALLRLLAHGKPIVGTNYAMRRTPIVPTARVFTDPTTGETEPLYTTPESAGLQDAAIIGLGCVLIETAVFAVVDAPWFFFYPTPTGSLGEDIGFCLSAIRKGIDVLVDHDLSEEVGHIGEMVFTNEHALSQREFLKEQDG